MNSDCTALVRAIVSSISDECRVARKGEWCHVALPFETSGGHFVEIAVNQIAPEQLLISDLGRTLSELISIGVDPDSNRTRARLEELQRDFGFTRRASEFQMVAESRTIGPALLRFAGALKTISDMAYLHRVVAATSYQINLAIRSILERDRIEFVEGEAARVRGVLEMQHALDFRRSASRRPFGIAVIGGTGTRRLAEVWGFRFGDIRTANPDVRRIAVYDDEDQNWSKESLNDPRLKARDSGSTEVD